MRWFWQREKQSAPPVDVEALKAEIRESVRREAGAATVEALRAVWPTNGSSPMMGAPSFQPSSTYPVYAWDNPIWWSTPQPPTRRPQSQVTTQTLRQLADTYDILRDCIQHLKREVHAVPLRIVAKDKKDDSDGTQTRIIEAEQFFSLQGGIGGVGRMRTEFEGMVIEDLTVIGAAAIYYAPTRGGSPYEVVAIDATTIRPRVDAFGWPGPDEMWYEQWINGVMVTGFTRQEMTYTGLSIQSRSYSPYYASPVEWLIYVVTSALSADQWNRSWLTDGSSVQDIIALPEAWTPLQVKQFSEYWDQLRTGNIAGRQKTTFVPGGSQKVGTNTRKDQDFQEFELWLMRRTCAMMGVQPASIGFAGEQYKVSQQDSMESTSAFGVGVLLQWRKDLYDDLLLRLGYGDLECQNVTAREEKATERAERNTKLVSGGIKTPNEGRAEEGLEAIEGGDTLFISSTLRPLEQALEPPPAPGGNDGARAGGNRGDRDGNADNPGNDTQRALGQWERKALNRLRAGKSADCLFAHPAIAHPYPPLIRERLAGCTTSDQVRAVFRTFGQLMQESEENA